MKEKFLKVWKETLLLGVVLLLVVIGVRLVWYQMLGEDYVKFYDTSTYSYLEEYEFGKIDSLRTPVYPLFIRIIGIFGEQAEDVVYARVTVVQEIISLASVFVFYLLMRKVTKNKVIQSVATLWYGCLPSIFSYNVCMLTESLAISLFVFFIYTLFGYLQNKKTYQVILLAVQTLLLVLLRPSFVYLFIFLAIFWILSFLTDKQNRKKVGNGVIATIVVGICLLGYAFGNKVQNGIFGLSYVNTINQADTILQMRLYGSFENDPVDEDITKIIEENISRDEDVWYKKTRSAILEKYDYNTLSQYMKKCVKHNLKSYSVATIRKVIETGNQNMNTVVAGKEENPKFQADTITISRVAFPITFAFAYFVICLEILIFIWERWKKETWTTKAQMRFYTAILIAGMIAVTILGAQAEYQRLAAPVLSGVIVLLACYLEKIGKKQED